MNLSRPNGICNIIDLVFKNLNFCKLLSQSLSVLKERGLNSQNKIIEPMKNWLFKLDNRAVCFTKNNHFKNKLFLLYLVCFIFILC